MGENDGYPTGELVATETYKKTNADLRDDFPSAADSAVGENDGYPTGELVATETQSGRTCGRRNRQRRPNRQRLFFTFTLRGMLRYIYQERIVVKRASRCLGGLVVEAHPWGPFI